MRETPYPESQSWGGVVGEYGVAKKTLTFARVPYLLLSTLTCRGLKGEQLRRAQWLGGAFFSLAPGGASLIRCDFHKMALIFDSRCSA